MSITLALIVLVVAFCVLQVVDGLTTWAILEDGGRELNPLVAWSIEHMGRLPGIVLAKACAIAAALLIAWSAIGNGASASVVMIVLLLLDALYAVIVYRNIELLR